MRPVLTYGLLLLVAWLDYLTGREVHLGSVYLLVVAMASWNLRPVGLIVFTVVTLAVWHVTEWIQGVHYAPGWAFYWNIFNRAGVVAITASMVYKAKTTVEHQQLLIRELGQTLLKVSRFKELVPVCRLCHQVHLGEEYHAKLQEILAEGADASTIGDVCPGCRAALTRRVENIPVESYFPDGES